MYFEGPHEEKLGSMPYSYKKWTHQSKINAQKYYDGKSFALFGNTRENVLNVLPWRLYTLHIPIYIVVAAVVVYSLIVT